MRGIGLALLIAVAVSACRSPPLVDRPHALGPSVVVRHVVETDVEVGEEQAEDPDRGGQMGRADPGSGSPDGRATRETRDRAGAAPSTGAAEDAPVGTTVTASRAPGRAHGEDHRASTHPPEPTEAVAPGAALEGDLAVLPDSPTQASTEQVEGERARSGASTSPWPWVGLSMVLIVATGLLIRRHRARSRLRSHRYDPDDAWDVFQAGLARKAGGGGSTG